MPSPPLEKIRPTRMFEGIKFDWFAGSGDGNHPLRQSLWLEFQSWFWSIARTRSLGDHLLQQISSQTVWGSRECLPWSLTMCQSGKHIAPEFRMKKILSTSVILIEMLLQVILGLILTLLALIGFLFNFYIVLALVLTKQVQVPN